ncbi:MAG: adenosylcobinamide-GDP ribazoletransferase [Clostridia bacterium]
MSALFHAIAFLTRIPVPRMTNDSRDWINSVAYYPLVGGLIGMFLWLLGLFANTLFPTVVGSIVVLVGWVYITGGLHVDGWMDVADGLGSNRERERMLAIMKDSRVGAMGAIACVLLLLFKAAAIYELSGQLAVFIAVPVAARFTLTVVIWRFPYLSTSGLGSGLCEGLSPIRLVAGLLFASGLSFGLSGWGGLVALAAAFVAAMLLARYLVNKLGGLNGDCYGAIVEGTEAAYMAVLLIGARYPL